MKHENYEHSGNVLNEKKEKKFFIAITLVIIMILFSQILQFSNSKIIDNKHENFIKEKNIIIQSSHSALIQVSTVQRMLLNLSIPNKIESNDSIRKKLINAAIENEISLFVILKSSQHLFNFNDSILYKIKAANLNYRKNYIKLISLINTGDAEKTDYFRINTLRPSLELYQELHQKLLLVIISEASNENDRIYGYKSISGWVIFIVGTFPYFFLLFFIRKALFN